MYLSKNGVLSAGFNKSINCAPPTFIYFRQIILAATGFVALIVDDRDTDPAELAVFFIEYQMTGETRVLHIGIVKFQCPRAGILRRGRGTRL